MDRLTFVDEKGNVLFTPKGCDEDVGYTITQLADGGHIDLLNEIACRLANHEQMLKKYKDLEEQGLMLRLPCKVGDTVYAICTCEAVGTVLDGTLYGSNGGFGTATGYYCPYELSDKCPHTEEDDCEECKNIENVFEDTVDYINITECEILLGLKNTNLCVTVDEIGKTVFLTKAEAEQKLKEMESD